MSNVLIILFLIFYLILAYIRLKWAVLAIIVLLPSYLIRFKVLGMPMTLLEGMILASFAVFLYANGRQIYANIKNKLGLLKNSAIGNRQSKIKRYPFDIEIILLLLVSLGAVAAGGFTDSAWGIWKAYFFEPALVFILVFNLTPALFPQRIRDRLFARRGGTQKRSPGLEKILFAFAISALGVSLLAVYQKFTGAWIFNELWANEETRRVTSFFGYPNAVGLYLGPLVLVFTGWLSSVILRAKPEESRKELKPRFFANAQNDKWLILFLGFTIISSIAAIYFAKSKGALIGVGAGLIVFALLTGKKSRWATIIILIILGGGILGYAPARKNIYNKFVYSKSWQIRKAGWQETWRMLIDGRIFSGAGLANYQTAVKPYHQEGIFYNDGADPDFHRHAVFDSEYRARVWQPLEVYLYPHNLVLNFWSELGMGGLLLFVWLITKYFVIGIKMLEKSVMGYKLLVIGLIGAMAVIVVHGLVDAPYFKNDLAVMFWIFLAMMGIIETKKLK